MIRVGVFLDFRGGGCYPNQSILAAGGTFGKRELSDRLTAFRKFLGVWLHTRACAEVSGGTIGEAEQLAHHTGSGLRPVNRRLAF